ncbi:transcription factor E2F7-like [Megalops cyprinoides]|uniref:transcription factor E2F7-like n=1 Tax=Megalops cyprinoides TaxID=118141 RepID=UPI001864CE7F|nr:transcription factor E2F7-like [Megalops cyprinoides]
METECLALRDLKSVRRSIADMDEEEGKNDQKENIFAERRKAPQHGGEPGSAAPLNGRKGLAPDQVNVTPVKPLDRALPDPWTPTANLKVLISAASPDIRDREMKKILFRPIENGSEEAATLDDPAQFDAADEDPDDFEKRPSRKQKSLGLLCQKFLSLYPDYPASSETTSISLDEVATSLGVERRRIYDIVNVLESLMLVSRVAKNHYLWHGRQQLRQTLRGLQGLGKQQGYHLQMEQLRDCRPRASAQAAEQSDHTDTGSAASRRKDKSLRIMSQKFVMLFLVSDTQTVTLDVAAKILIEESQDMANHSKYKTKVRRLYDIANVLTSLGLIQKVHVKEERGRKPAFKWIGPAQFQTCEELEARAAISLPELHKDTLPPLSGGGKRRLARHASFNVVPTSAATQRRVSSAPSSPHREVTGLIPEPVDYSRRAVSSNAVCRLQFGDDRGAQPSVKPRTLTPKISPVSLVPVAVPIQQESLPSLPCPYTGTAQPRTPVPPVDPTPIGGGSEAHPPAHTLNPPQAPVVMLYGRGELERMNGAGEGQRSPASETRQGMLGKRKISAEEDEEGHRARRLTYKEEEPSHEKRWWGQSESESSSPRTSPGSGLQHPAVLPQGEAPPVPLGVPPPSHYLYVPNSTGLNLLLSAGSAPSGLALSPGAVPALAVPYVLVPSSALSPYQLVAAGLPVACGDAHGKISFGMPAVMSPAHFVVGASSFTVPGVPGFGVPSPTLTSPEQAVSADSPVEPGQPTAPFKTEPQTPLTPKEADPPASRAFFQTPGTLGSSSPPAARKRGSAQRRLDIGHPPAN